MFNDLNKNILIYIIFASGFIMFLLTIYTSLKNPGFYKPNNKEDKDQVNKNMV